MDACLSILKLSPRSVTLSTDDTQASSTDKQAAHTLVLDAYLGRIGFTPAEAEALKKAQPNAADLGRLLTAHYLAVPFENLSQHDHPAEGTSVPAVEKNLPTLQIEKTLTKIVFDKRGGFCWEINMAFAWLLRTLGYRVRIGSSHVITPGGPVPGHLCLFVDGLGPCAILVDPGFGDTVRVPVPVETGVPVSDDALGDSYVLEKNDASKFGQSAEQAARFDLVLMRSRKVGIAGSPLVAFFGMDAPPPAAAMTPPEPVVLLNSTDDLPLDADELSAGLASVLVEHEMNIFSQKRMALRLNAAGYTFVGQDYVKTVADGVEVSRTALEGEEAYRAALERHLGIVL